MHYNRSLGNFNQNSTRKKFYYLDLLLDFSLAWSSSIIKFGELDLLSATSCRCSGLLDLDEALPDLDLDFLLLGLPLPDRERLLALRDLGLFDLDFEECDLVFGLCDLDLGLCDLDFGLCDLDFGLWDRDLGLCPDFRLGERELALPDLDLALPDPDLERREPLLDRDLEALSFGLPDAWDFGLEEPDLLLWGDPAGELDLLRETFEAFDDFRERPELFDFGDSLPDRAGLRDTDLKIKILNYHSFLFSFLTLTKVC